MRIGGLPSTYYPMDKSIHKQFQEKVKELPKQSMESVNTRTLRISKYEDCYAYQFMDNPTNVFELFEKYAQSDQYSVDDKRDIVDATAAVHTNPEFSLYFRTKEDIIGKILDYTSSLGNREADKTLLSKQFDALMQELSQGESIYSDSLSSRLTIQGVDFSAKEFISLAQAFETSDKTIGDLQSITNGYDRYSLLGMASSKIGRYATEHLNEEQREIVMTLASKKITDLLESSIAASVHQGDKYHVDGKPSNDQMKRDLFNLFANLDTSSDKAFQSSFENAKSKYSAIMEPYEKELGYKGRWLKETNDGSYDLLRKAFSGEDYFFYVDPRESMEDVIEKVRQVQAYLDSRA